MTTKLTRRTALLGSVTLPAAIAPLGAGAEIPDHTDPANATDAAWAELQAAKAVYEADRDRRDAIEDGLPAHVQLRNSPAWADYADRGEWLAAREKYERERARYTSGEHIMSDEQLDAFLDRITGAEKAVLDTPAATLTDLERKLILIRDDGGTDEHADLDRLIADVQALDGRGVS